MSGVVVDTSVWIDYLAGKDTPILENALRQGSVLLPPIVLAELVSGAHRPRERTALVDFLTDLSLCKTLIDHWIRVGELRRRCREKGISVSTPDAHVAQCALDVDALLLTYDRIFREIARLANLRLYPNPHFLRGFVARRRRRAWIQGARREDSAGVLDSTSRNPTERNAVDMPGSAAAVEAS